MDKKFCNKCNEDKPLDDFYKNKSKKSGYQTFCKDCTKSSTKVYRKNNKEYFKNYGTKYREQNLQYFIEYNKEYRKNNEKYKNQKAAYAKNRRKTDPMFKLQGNLRNRIYIMFKFNDWKKNKQTEEILGASYKEVKLHIESTFQEGMLWENHGRCKEDNCNEVWHIDHKIPLSSAKTEDELIKLCHYTNLQALWGDENISKGDKL